MAIEIGHVDSNFERERLAQPYGFKGSYLTELWQSVVLLESTSGHTGVGLGTQSVLWADSSVFAKHTESGGNALMYALTERALRLASEISFDTPVDLLDALLDELHDYGKAITGNPQLKRTFVLNALVPVDHAAWLVYAAENGITSFDEMIPDAYRPGLSERHNKVASIPTFGYDAPIDSIRQAAKDGYYFMKIKIGQPGTQKEMLEKDMAYLAEVHKALKDVQTPYTESGNIPYYLDANGRYEEINTVRRLLDYADEIGALERIVILEEPLSDGRNAGVGDLPVRVAADESADTAEEAMRVIERGYGSIALKPVAKTLSMTMKVAQVAFEHDVPCFCADLTVNPILVDWNKNVAARLHPLPGFSTGLLETNGHQNYENWEGMAAHHPMAGADWTDVEQGVFNLGDPFYQSSGGIFADPAHYSAMVHSE